MHFRCDWKPLHHAWTIFIGIGSDNPSATAQLTDNGEVLDEKRIEVSMEFVESTSNWVPHVYIYICPYHTRWYSLPSFRVVYIPPWKPQKKNKRQDTSTKTLDNPKEPQRLRYPVFSNGKSRGFVSWMKEFSVSGCPGQEVIGWRVDVGDETDFTYWKITKKSWGVESRGEKTNPHQTNRWSEQTQRNNFLPFLIWYFAGNCSHTSFCHFGTFESMMFRLSQDGIYELPDI